MNKPSPFLIPEKLESTRIVLRTFREEDWHFLHEHYSDAECTRFTFRRALTEAETWYTLASIVGHWQLRGYGPYAVEEKSTGIVLGTVGLWYPKEWPSPEIKWALARRHWRKGFASEAVRAVQAMAREHVPAISPISVINAENAPSIALALAVGAKWEKEIQFRGGTHHVYRHPRENVRGT